MLKPIQKDDIVVRRFKTFKNWSLNSTTANRYYGENITGSVFNPDDEQTINGFYPRLVYSSIKTQYYLNASTGSALDFGYRKNLSSTDERILEDKLIVITISPSYIGEGIKRESVTITDVENNIVLKDDGFSNLIADNEILGNIFYEHGVAVITKNVTSSSFNDFYINFKSTQTIYEQEIFLTVEAEESNFSTNPSAVTIVNGERYVKDDFVSITNPSVTGSFGDYFQIGLSDPTGSYLTPYITTIGLYDDNYDLVVVAKLAQPVKKTPDYTINFVVRFDM
jgi:hypothetical protein